MDPARESELAGPAGDRGHAGTSLRGFRGILAVVTGYVALVLLSTLVQEVWLQGVSYRDSSLSTLVLAAIFTPLSAVVAGYLTAAIARRRLLLHGLPLALAIAAETTALYVTGRVDGPLWFEMLAGAALIAGIGLGLWIWHRRRPDVRE